MTVSPSPGSQELAASTPRVAPAQPLGRSAVHGVLWSATGAALGKLFGVGAFVVLARLLTPDDFGVVSLATAFTAILAIFIEGGLTRAIVQRAEVTDDHLNTAFWINLAASVLLTGLLIATAPLIAVLLKAPSLAPILQVLALALLLAPFSVVQGAIMQRELRFRELALRTLGASTAGSLAGLVCALLGMGAWSLVMATLFASAAAILTLWRVSTWRPKFSASWSAARDLMSFSTSVLATRLVAAANYRVTQLLIGGRLSTVELGVYTVSTRVKLNLADLLVFTTTRVAFPTFARIQQEEERLRRAYLTGIKLSTAVSLPAFVGLSVLAPDVVPAFFGDKWLAAIPVMIMLTPAGFVNALTAYDAQMITAKGRPNLNLAISVAETIVAIVVTIATLPGGVVAVALGQTIRTFAFWPVRFIVVQRLANVTVGGLVGAVWAPVAATAVMSLCIIAVGATLPLPTGSWLRLILLTVLGAVTYAAALAALGPAILRQILDLLLHRSKPAQGAAAKREEAEPPVAPERDGIDE